MISTEEKYNGITLYRVKNDINGNGRYVVHFLCLADIYDDAEKIARKLGGRKYTGRWFGGGFVFTTSSPDYLTKSINKMKTIKTYHIIEILKNAGFNLVSFDIFDRQIEISIAEDVYLTALNMIDKKTELSEELVKLAENFCFNWSKLVKKHSDGIRLDKVIEDNYYKFDQEANELEKEFIKEIGEEALSMLRNEYEFLTSNDKQ
jgi:hypothetical protein